MKVPFLSIPRIDDIDLYDIGFWLWTKPSNEQHCVFIERRDSILIAGADLNGERLIAGMWQGTLGHPLGHLLGYQGKYAENMNLELSESETTERIWDFIQGQAITMQLAVVLGKIQVGENEDYYEATGESMRLRNR